MGYTSVPAVALAAAAVVDWHVTLRFLGVSATLVTVAARITSYSSPQVRRGFRQARQLPINAQDKAHANLCREYAECMRAVRM